MRDEADERCIRWGHHVRRVTCSNPNCPSRRPDLWGEALRMLNAREQLQAPGDGDAATPEDPGDDEGR